MAEFIEMHALVLGQHLKSGSWWQGVWHGTASMRHPWYGNLEKAPEDDLMDRGKLTLNSYYNGVAERAEDTCTFPAGTLTECMLNLSIYTLRFGKRHPDLCFVNV